MRINLKINIFNKFNEDYIHSFTEGEYRLPKPSHDINSFLLKHFKDTYSKFNNLNENDIVFDKNKEGFITEISCFSENNLVEYHMSVLY